MNPLPGLFHHRWTVPTLAALDELGGGAKLVTLQRKLGASRELLKRTLGVLGEARLVARNPGYGHPMRPEYVLTAAGRLLAPACARLLERLQRLGVAEVGLKKWSLPVALALATASGRFNRVLAALEGVTPRALAQALRDLQEVGLVERRLVDGHPPRTEYRLTHKGRHLTPSVLAVAAGAPVVGSP
jgi:DNA-binding HxlR family transcriptional regulator